MKPRLLLIDDDHSVLNALNKLLQREGFEILLAGTGAEALELFAVNRVDLTLLDLNLGEETGWSVLERMSEINPSVPTIIVTAEFGQRAKAMAAGAKELIEKPIDVPSFLQIIRDVLARTDSTHSRDDAKCREHCFEMAALDEQLVRSLAERCSTPMLLSKALRSVLDCPESTVEPDLTAPSLCNSSQHAKEADPKAKHVDSLRQKTSPRMRMLQYGWRRAGTVLRRPRRVRKAHNHSPGPKNSTPAAAGGI